MRKANKVYAVVYVELGDKTDDPQVLDEKLEEVKHELESFFDDIREWYIEDIIKG
jgi:hypothetical protein